MRAGRRSLRRRWCRSSLISLVGMLVIVQALGALVGGCLRGRVGGRTQVEGLEAVVGSFGSAL